MSGGMNPAIGEPRWLRWLLCLLAAAVLGVVMLLPLAAVFTEALRRGLPPALAALADPDALAAALELMLFDDEAITAAMLGGLALILGGVALASGAVRLPRREPATMRT